MRNRDIRYIRPQKYHNKSSRCSSGHWHQSVLEANYCDDLRILMQAGEISGYRTQVSFELKVNNKSVCTHVVDFLVYPKEGEDPEIHETKGYATKEWYLKYKLFRALYPKMPYYIIEREKKNDYRRYLSRTRRRSR